MNKWQNPTSCVDNKTSEEDDNGNNLRSFKINKRAKNKKIKESNLANP